MLAKSKFKRNITAMHYQGNALPNETIPPRISPALQHSHSGFHCALA
jgi:hypothetical protein